MASIKFTTSPTTLFRYNIKPKTFIHIPFHPSLCFPKSSLPFSIFAAIHTSCNIYIVMFVILVHCPLPGSSRFFLSFIKKTPQEFLIVSLFRLPQISLSSRWILHERYSFSYSFIRKLNTTSFNFLPFFVKEQIYVDANIINLIIPIIIYFSTQSSSSIKFKQFKELVIKIII